jgi:hypothetical protein
VTGDDSLRRLPAVADARAHLGRVAQAALVQRPVDITLMRVVPTGLGMADQDELLHACFLLGGRPRLSRAPCRVEAGACAGRRARYTIPARTSAGTTMHDHRRLSDRIRILVALLLCLTAGARAADAPDVRELMTPDEFRAAGLERLSPAEIEALNRWLIRYTAREAPTQRRASPAVREEIAKEDATEIRTRIDGAFTGWDGHTVFILQNGQVWQQRTEGRWRRKLDSPEVVFEKNPLGFWMMRVIDGDRAVGVKRVR